jgi:hypothetical protein
MGNFIYVAFLSMSVVVSETSKGVATEAGSAKRLPLEGAQWRYQPPGDSNHVTHIGKTISSSVLHTLNMVLGKRISKKAKTLFSVNFFQDPHHL